MRALIVIAALIVLVYPWWLAIRRRPLSSTGQVSINHQQMARWIDRHLHEGYVMEHRRDEARRLLDEFYGRSPRDRSAPDPMPPDPKN